MDFKNSFLRLKKYCANYFGFNKSLMAGFVGAATFIAVYESLHLNTPQIGSVNVHKLVNAHIEKRAKSTLSQKELEADSRAFVAKLERAFANLAKQKNLQLIISDVVVTNIKDYTDTIRNALEEQPK